MDDLQLQRYSRHILLDEIGVEGQQRIRDSSVLIIGLGGLGCPAAMYLASSGIGRITLVDADTVDLTNLQRQILHNESGIGQAKVDSAATALAALNSDITITKIAKRADSQLLNELVPQHDVILDCSDNFATRHAVNRASVQHLVPLVSGAALRFDGQLMVFDPRMQEGACYACLFPEEDKFEEVRCAVMGIFAPIVGIIGTMQAASALQLLINPGLSKDANQLLLLDGHHLSIHKIEIHKRQDCKVCSASKVRNS